MRIRARRRRDFTAGRSWSLTPSHPRRRTAADFESSRRCLVISLPTGRKILGLTCRRKGEPGRPSAGVPKGPKGVNRTSRRAFGPFGTPSGRHENDPARAVTRGATAPQPAHGAIRPTRPPFSHLWRRTPEVGVGRASSTAARPGGIASTSREMVMPRGHVGRPQNPQKAPRGASAAVSRVLRVPAPAHLRQGAVHSVDRGPRGYRSSYERNLRNGRTLAGRPILVHPAKAR